MAVPKDYHVDNMSLYHIADDGKLTEIPFKVVDGKVSFTTDHLSIYALVDHTKKADNTNTTTQTKPSRPNKQEKPIKGTAANEQANYALVIMLMACAGIYVGFNFKRKSNKA